MKSNFNSNIKYLREKDNLTQNEMGKKCGVDQTTIARWEDQNRVPTVETAVTVAENLNIPIEVLLYQDLRFDNGTPVDVSENNTVLIPVLGTIKAGIAIEAQQDILEYVDIPKSWLRGGKTFYGLRISGDSMEPKYCEKDIVIFEQCSDNDRANNKDCAVMVNGYDATFKRVNINENGITLTPLNINNSDGYQPTHYNIEQVQQLPVRIIGIGKEKRTRL